jgi:hypothetical protein
MRWRYVLLLRRSVLSLCAIFLAGVSQTRASVFIIDSNQTQITISGEIAGYTFTAQGAGSLTAAYLGNLNATVSGSTIQFTGLSALTAIPNGVWRPAAGGAAGSAPADYGMQVVIPLSGTGYAATRNLVLDMTSPVLTLTQTNFDSSQLIISVVTNSNPVFDYYNIGLQSGSDPMSGNATNSVATGSFISTNGGVLQLVIQISTTLLGTNNGVLNLTGQIVATNSLSAFAAPVITGMVATNQNLILSVSNATAQSQLLSSTDLTTWSPAGATLSTNGGLILFTTPRSGPRTFFRVQQ